MDSTYVIGRPAFFFLHVRCVLAPDIDNDWQSADGQQQTGQRDSLMSEG